MKKFCVIFLVFAVLGSLFAQEDWPEFRWPEQRTVITPYGIITDDNRDNVLFKDNWERLIPMLSWEEVTDYNLASTRLLRLYEYDRTPQAITVRQAIESALTSSGSYRDRYQISFWPNFYNDKHLYTVSWIFQEGRSSVLRARAFLSPVGPSRNDSGSYSFGGVGSFLSKAVKDLNCGLEF
jgi:hypothetical protein